MKTSILILLLLVVGCTPATSQYAQSPGIYVIQDPQAGAFTQTEVETIYAEVSMCVAGYVIPPNFTVHFDPTESVRNGQLVNGFVDFYSDGRIDVHIYKPLTLSKLPIVVLYHEFTHVVLHYYGITTDGNVDHTSIKFDECVPSISEIYITP